MKTNVMFCMTFSLVCLFAMSSISSAATLFVDSNAPTGGDGTSFATPYKYLQDALLSAQEDDDIRLGGGIYRPDQSEHHSSEITLNDRNETFLVDEDLNGLVIIGGFAGYQSAGGASVLTGAINTSSLSDNSYNVVTIQDVDFGNL